ncbi:hypothetical protein ACFCP7_20475 [Paenibacillus elgii]
MEFDWTNLFYACGHCNNIKGAKYDDILNCTDPSHDVERWIHYRKDPYPKASAVFTPLRDDQIVHHTIELLREVFGGRTALKTIEAQNLKSRLLDELYHFQDIPFTAFKRWIIRDNPDLFEEFGHLIEKLQQGTPR